MFQNKKVVVFDMDGTLIDSIGIWNTADRFLINELGFKGELIDSDLQKRRDDLLRKYSKEINPYISYCEELGRIYGSNLKGEEILKLRYNLVQSLLKEKIDYKENAADFVKLLNEKGLTVGIASTTRRDNMRIYKEDNQNIISKADLNKYFKFIYTREDAKEIKPNPEIYLKVIEEYGISKEECLIVEDSKIGLDAALNAGIDCTIIYDKYSKEDEEYLKENSTSYFNNYKELIDLLNEEIGG